VARGSARLKVLPGPSPADDAPPLACKRPLCGRAVEQPSGRSRPREFCSDACRVRYQRERDLARAALSDAQRVAAQYGAGAPPGPRTNPSTLESEFSASYQALSLIAQALESARNDLDDGVPLTAEVLLSTLTRAKLAGDRLLRSRNS
jgi:hypothetical protein